MDAACNLSIFILHVRYNQFYNAGTFLSIKVVTGVMTWLGVVEVLTQFVPDFTFSILGAVFICGVLLAFTLIYSTSRLGQLTDICKHGVRSPGEMELVNSLMAAIEVKKLAAKGDSSNDYLLSSFLQTHVEHCTNETCLSRNLRDTGKLSVAKYRAEMLVAFQYALNRKFKEILLRHPDFATIRMIYVGFLIFHVKNYILAWEINEGTRAFKTNLVQRLHLYCYRHPRQVH